jgi:8-amino-7-oxononanoate synthase
LSGNGRWKWMHNELEQLSIQSQYRELQECSPSQEAGWVIRDGKKLLNLSSNHYLGLSQNIHLHSNTVNRIGDLRTGSTASRLIVGNDPIFAKLERDFAAFKHTQDCLVFSNGYMANMGTIQALCGRDDIVFSDKLNHASITDGIVLSRAEHVRYRHRDTDHLEHLLRKADPKRKKLIVTDAVFSMDGTIAPLKQLVELKEQYNAYLMVDEAHSGGVFGDQGEGLVHMLGLTDRVDVHMGTFSKAYGCYGAYIAGDAVVKSYLINKTRSFIYTTALPSLVVSVVYDNWQTAVNEGWRRRDVLERSAWFRQQLQSAGFDTGESECQIIPIIVGDNAAAIQFSVRLREEGIAAVPIRPPTVPEGTARIRFTLMATHRLEDLQQAVNTITTIGQEQRLI